MTGGEPVTLAAAVLAGLLGSGHCLAMCGGIAGAGALGVDRPTPLAGRLLVYNLGRVASYAAAGAVAGGAGLWLGDALGADGWAGYLRAATGLVMMAVGLQIALGWRLLRPVEALGARFWRLLAPLGQRLLPARGLGATLALGLLWGWLPCGLVYAMLLAAAAAGGSLEGASVMAAFGAGTLPSMLATGAAAGQLARWARRPGLRAAAGMLVVGFGVWTLAGPPVLHGLMDHGD